MKKTIEEKLELLPTEPGCYLMKDKNGTIIYVGKAKKLKNRVSSYFHGAHDYKTTKMISHIDDFDTIITSTEKESLILEINLIKEHRPRFNILFMDDKSYPYLKVAKKGKPEVIVSRDRKPNPNYSYFGPYPDATAARSVASVLNDSVPNDEGVLLPNTQAIYGAFNRTAKRYSEEEYSQWRTQVVSILNGQSGDFYAALESKMIEASSALNFELAQLYKEKLDGIEYISDRQQVQFNRSEQFDMFHYAHYQGYIAIVGLFVRSGRLLERSMAVEASLEEPQDALVSFIAQYYQNQPKPKHIYVPDNIDKEAVSEVINAPVNHALRGKKRALLEIAQKNAQQQLDDQFQLLRKRQTFKDDALSELETLFNLKTPLHRIEVFDNSHISGDYAVSACVVFDDGEPNKSQYRRYRLHQGNDDVASMKEVLYRRYFRILKEEGIFPDLILVDGGKGQLNAAIEILESLDLKIAVGGMVKDDRHRTHALLLSNGEEAQIDVRSPLFAFITHMQDEVHRYVITYHKLLRKKAMTKSILDEVSGLGPKRQKLLYKEYGSLRGIRGASLESLKSMLPEEVAQELYDIIHIDWNEDDEK